MSTKFLKSSWNGWFLSTKITSISGRIMYDALSRCSPAIVWIVWGCVSASIACAVTDVCKSLFTLFQCEKILFIHQTVAWNKVLPTITTRKQSNKLRNMVVQHWSIPISNRIQNVSELIQHPSQETKSSSSSFLFSENLLDLRISHGQQHPFCAPKAPRVIGVRTSLERCRRSPRWRARWCWSKRRRRCRRTSAFLRRCFIWFNHGVPREPSRTIQYHTF